MDKTGFIKKIKSQIIKADLQVMFDLLHNNVCPKSDRYNEFLLLNHRYNKNKVGLINDSLPYEVYSREDNKITEALLHWVDQISESDLNSNIIDRVKEILNPVLVVCSSDESRQYMQKIFSLLNFKNAKVIVGEKLEDITEFDLVIFDNRKLKDCPSEALLSKLSDGEKHKIEATLSLMETYISKTDKFLIHFGERLFWINKNRERVYAANSKFALYARIKEMLDFIASYRT
jgi:hypothetical protein